MPPSGRASRSSASQSTGQPLGVPKPRRNLLPLSKLSLHQTIANAFRVADSQRPFVPILPKERLEAPCTSPKRKLPQSSGLPMKALKPRPTLLPGSNPLELSKALPRQTLANISPAF